LIGYKSIKNELKNNKILLLSIFCIFSISLFSQEIERWKMVLIPEINLETNKQVNKGCLKDSIAWQKFYQNELQYFPIEKAFDRIKELSKDLKRKESIILELYYPIVGFDPETGYTTNLYVNKRRRIRKLELYDQELKDFKESIGKHKYIVRRLKTESDCYGTGYSFITIFDMKMKISDVKVTLSLELN